MRKTFSIMGMVVCSVIMLFGVILVCAGFSDSKDAPKLIAAALLSGISGYRMIGFGLFGICLFGALMETPKTAPVINIPQSNPESKVVQVTKVDPEREQKAQDIAYEMQMKMGGISKASPAPVEEKPVINEIKTLPEMLAYAGKYSSDSGMTEYLRREKDSLPEEDRAKLEELLSLPPKEIREAIKKMTEEA